MISIGECSEAKSQSTNRYKQSQENRLTMNKNHIQLTPALKEKSHVIIPISMGRYNIDQKKTKQYDKELKALFEYTALLLKIKFINQVDIVSSAGLQAINWPAPLVSHVEEHFISKHNNLLKQQSNFYTWDQFIEKLGVNNYNRTYKEILYQSRENTEWYNLMQDTHISVKSSLNLKQSIEYQRREYAAIRLMDHYDHIIYLGKISPAWAYLYHTFKTLKPLYTKAEYKNNSIAGGIQTYDVNHSIRMILSNIEATLLSENIPDKEKKRLVNSTLSLLYAYAP